MGLLVMEVELSVQVEDFQQNHAQTRMVIVGVTVTKQEDTATVCIFYQSTSTRLTLLIIGRSQFNGGGSEWNDNEDNGDNAWGSSEGNDRPRGRGRGIVCYY